MTLGNMRKSRSAPRSDDDAAVRLICTRFWPVLNYALASEWEALRLKGLAIGTLCILAADVAQAGSLRSLAAQVTLRSGR